MTAEDRSFFVTDANGTIYLAEPSGVWEDSDGYQSVNTNRPATAWPLYRLTVQEPT